MTTSANVSGYVHNPWGISIDISLTNDCASSNTGTYYCWNGIDTSPLDPDPVIPDPNGKKANNSSTGLAESSESSELTETIRVYPNPSSMFNIDLTHVKGEYDNVKVYNLLGSLVYESNLNPKSLNQINLSGFATGNYIAKASGKSGSNSFQLIKI